MISVYHFFFLFKGVIQNKLFNIYQKQTSDFYEYDYDITVDGTLHGKNVWVYASHEYCDKNYNKLYSNRTLVNNQVATNGDYIDVALQNSFGNLKLKQNSVYTKFKDVLIKQSGSWKKANSLYFKSNNQWKKL